ncbi:phage tail protein [Pseudomonas sp. Irchel s3a12]|uniref:phage tail protein n=1 Tax=Pseudomonas sp. Irchel s3a12 TaxID=2009047 RepID=UPI000BA4238B|nr:phage tail protein [Pseudomonas sp. Irchel s3a12]
MVDQNSIFGGMLTTLGAAKKTNCDALGIPWEPRYMLIGDANGTDPVPSPSQTRLINQRYRAQLNQLRVSPTDDNVLIAELVLPPDVGGWWIRELALEDKDGVFSAVSNVAPSYKPLLTQGSGRNQVVRMHIITSGTSNIQLKIDPSVVLATREYVDTRILEELYKLDNKQSVRVATTGNILLSGLLTIDGVPLLVGDRVLVKNQNTAKDNGIWVAAAGAWTRSSDADSDSKVTSALLVSVEQGTTLADTRWQLITDGAIVLGTTPLMFQNVTYGFAPIKSPAFLDNPTAPTPVQFDSSKSLPTTEFVQRALGNDSDFAILVGVTTLNAGHAGKLIYAGAGGNYTVTLPSAAAVKAGTRLPIVMFASQPCFIATQPGQLIYFNGSQTLSSIALGLGDSLTVESDGANWYAVGGSAQLKYSSAFGSSISTNGYQKLASGLIMQWGTVMGSASGPVPFSFYMAFPSVLLSLTLSVAITPGSNGVFGTLESQSTAGASYQAWSSSTNRVALNCYYVAIGR